MLVLQATTALAHEGRAEPLGDGNISTQPQAGYIWSCQQSFNSNAPGAKVNGYWIDGKLWYPDEKIAIQGNILWPNSSISVGLENGARIIRANNLPKHATGQFPVAQNDPAFQYDRNPNSISAQNILLTLPAMPQIAAVPSCVPMGMIGFALSGTAIFNGLDAGGRDAAAHEVQDKCNGHPQMSGQYHYHSYSPCMADASGAAGKHSDLVGYALDGFGIYGLHGEDGRELASKDLDACHGHTHMVMWNGKMQSIYHYHLTRDYPYTLGCFKGTPVASNFSASEGQQHRGPPAQQGGNMPQGVGGMNGDPPRDPGKMMRDAATVLGISPDALRNAVGPPPPDFTRASQQLGIPEATVRAAFEQARQQQ